MPWQCQRELCENFLRLHCWPGVCFRFRFFNSSKSFIQFWTGLTWGPSLCQCAALLSAGVSGECCGLNPSCFALCKDASFSLPGQHLLSFLHLPPDSISEVHPGNPTSTEGLQAWQRGGLRWVQLMGRSGWKRRQRERSSAGQNVFKSYHLAQCPYLPLTGTACLHQRGMKASSCVTKWHWPPKITSSF